MNDGLLNAVAGLGLINQASQNPWYDCNSIAINKGSWIDTAISATPDPNYKTLRKRKYLNYN